jgi:hypothetical protein
MVCGVQGYNPWKFFEAKLEWAYSNEKFEEDRAKGYFPNQVASVLAAAGAAAVRQSTTTFADFFWDIWRQRGHRLPEADAVVQGRTPTEKKLADFVFMFCMSCDRQSLVLAHGDSDTVRHTPHTTHHTPHTTHHTPHTTHHTPHTTHHTHLTNRARTQWEERLVLHGVRDMTTLEEEADIEPFAHALGCATPQRIYNRACPAHNRLRDIESPLHDTCGVCGVRVSCAVCVCRVRCVRRQLRVVATSSRAWSRW